MVKTVKSKIEKQVKKERKTKAKTKTKNTKVPNVIINITNKNNSKKSKHKRKNNHSSNKKAINRMGIDHLNDKYNPQAITSLISGSGSIPTLNSNKPEYSLVPYSKSPLLTLPAPVPDSFIPPVAVPEPEIKRFSVPLKLKNKTRRPKFATGFKPLDKITIPQLKAKAKELNINTKGFTRKEQYIEALYKKNNEKKRSDPVIEEVLSSDDESYSSNDSFENASDQVRRANRILQHPLSPRLDAEHTNNTFTHSMHDDYSTHGQFTPIHSNTDSTTLSTSFTKPKVI